MAWHFTRLFWEPSANCTTSHSVSSFGAKKRRRYILPVLHARPLKLTLKCHKSAFLLLQSPAKKKTKPKNKQKKRSRLSFYHEYYQYFNTFSIGFGAKRHPRTIDERRFLQTTGWQWGRLWGVYLFKHLPEQEKVKRCSKVPCGGCQIKRNVSKTVRGG